MNVEGSERSRAESLVGLYSGGHDEEAIAYAKELITWFPDNLTAWQVLGAIFDKRRSFDQALACKKRAAELDKEGPHSLSNLGNSYTRAGRFEDAVQVYRDVVHTAPSYLDGHVNLANALNELQRFQEARDVLLGVSQLEPKTVLYFRNLGNACKGLKLLDEAVRWYENGLLLDPDSGQLYSNLSAVLFEQERFEEALVFSAKGVSLSPDSAEAHYNHGVALQEVGSYRDAASHASRAASLRPEYAEAYLSRGVSEHALGHLQEAVAAYDSAIAVRPDYGDARVNRGLLLLLTGDYERGFADYRWRFASGKAKQVKKSARRDFGYGFDDLAARDVFVHWEQGLGDTIQFCRYVADLTRVAKATTFCVLPKTRRLLEALSPDIYLTTVDLDEAAVSRDYDFHIPLLDLPMILGVDPQKERARPPYLRAEPGRVAFWRARLGAYGHKIGICWQGSTAPVDRGRSFPVGMFGPIQQRLKGVRLISLHKGAGENQLDLLPNGMVVENYSAELDQGEDAFLDTAAVMQCLDLVITSDTSIAHLAGALGIKTWLLLKFIPDWRWGLGTSDCFWYSSVRLFRQTTPGDWSSVFKDVEEMLEKEVVDGR